MYRQTAHNISYIIINNQQKFLVWDPTKQINYGRHASKIVGGVLSFSIALSYFITISENRFEPPGLKNVPASVLVT